MQHAVARRVIATVMDGTGFADHAIAMAAAAVLADLPGIPDEVRSSLLQQACALGPDGAAESSGPLCQAPVPSDAGGLCRQFAPFLTEHPGDVASNLCSLWAMAQLWPHVTTSERPVLRQRLHASVSTRQAPAGSFATISDLRTWQRDLPTSFEILGANLATLKAILVQPTAKGAYQVLAEHLGMHMDLKTLSWVMGSLVAQISLMCEESGQRTSRLALAAVASEALAAEIRPEIHATLLSQFALQIWWCRRQVRPRSGVIATEGTVVPLDLAITSGDALVAQRSARATATNPGHFWHVLWTLAVRRAGEREPGWPGLVEASLATRLRAGTQAVPPDDAAALATVYAVGRCLPV